MRRKRSVLRAVVMQSGSFTTHVAVLACSEVRGVKGQRVALGELRVLPLVINGKGADELVIVQRVGQVGLVAGGTEFRRPVKRLHDRLRVTLGMLEDIAKRNLAGNSLAVLVYHHRGNAHDVTAVTRSGLQLLDRMTGGASQTVSVKRAIDVRVLRQRAREHGDRIVAAIAMTRELDAFGADQDVDARPVERCAE